MQTVLFRALCHQYGWSIPAETPFRSISGLKTNAKIGVFARRINEFEQE